MEVDNFTTPRRLSDLAAIKVGVLTIVTNSSKTTLKRNLEREWRQEKASREIYETEFDTMHRIQTRKQTVISSQVSLLLPIPKILQELVQLWVKILITKLIDWVTTRVQYRIPMEIGDVVDMFDHDCFDHLGMIKDCL